MEKSIIDKLLLVINSFEEDVSEKNINDNIFELGINSIQFIQFMLKLEDEFGIEFDLEELDYDNYENLYTIAKHIEKLLNERH